MAAKFFDLVADTTSTTGTGAITVSGSAPAGGRTFSAVLSVNDTCIISIRHQSLSEFEVVEAVYSASNQLTRSGRIFASSNSGSAVNFSSGVKYVDLVNPANFGTREVLTATRNYYVRSDGTDTNTGLANTSSGAFRQINKAIQVVSGLIDCGGQEVNINVADGSYDHITLLDWVGATPTNQVNIIGNTTTPANVTITSTSAFVSPVYSSSSRQWKLSGIKLAAGSAGGFTPIVNAVSCNVLEFTSMDFGAPAASCPQIFVDRGARVTLSGSNNISAGGENCLYAVTNSFIEAGASTFVYSNSPVYTHNFFAANNSVISAFGMTFTNGGTVTGARYLTFQGGGINTSGGGASYIPGNSAGSATSPGWYA